MEDTQTGYMWWESVTLKMTDATGCEHDYLDCMADDNHRRLSEQMSKMGWEEDLGKNGVFATENYASFRRRVSPDNFRDLDADERIKHLERKIEQLESKIEALQGEPKAPEPTINTTPAGSVVSSTFPGASWELKIKSGCS